MRGKIRQWFVDNPRAMTAAYFFVLGASMFVQLSPNEASGATAGP